MPGLRRVAVLASHLRREAVQDDLLVVVRHLGQLDDDTDGLVRVLTANKLDRAGRGLRILERSILEKKVAVGLVLFGDLPAVVYAHQTHCRVPGPRVAVGRFVRRLGVRERGYPQGRCRRDQKPQTARLRRTKGHPAAYTNSRLARPSFERQACSRASIPPR